jgi:tripartite-type tricarboxylate transporter receptor subunit TctC
MKTFQACLAALAGAIWGWAAPALAEYPEKDITFIVPHGPGGTFDTYVRAISPALERYLPKKVNVVPTNLPGGNQAKAMNTLFRAKPDGYTISIVDVPGALLPQVINDPVPAYDLKKFTWLAVIGSDPYGVAVNRSSPIKSVDDMKNLGRPMKVTTTGPGTTSYMVAKISADAFGFPVNIISGYRSSSDYAIGAIRGDGDGTVAVVPILKKYSESGDLRPVVMLAKKSPFAGVPDSGALGHPELETLAIRRLIAGPPGLPDNIRKVLEDALIKAMKDPETIKIMSAAGADMEPEDGAAAAKLVNDSFEFYTKYRKYVSE